MHHSNPSDSCTVYLHLPTFTININQVYVNIPYTDPMGNRMMSRAYFPPELRVASPIRLVWVGTQIRKKLSIHPWWKNRSCTDHPIFKSIFRLKSDICLMGSDIDRSLKQSKELKQIHGYKGLGTRWAGAPLYD